MSEPTKVTKATHPALWQLLRMDPHDWRAEYGNGGRLECADCPFATNPVDVNRCDEGEGYYDCAKLGLKAVWGEGPKCNAEMWLQWAREELGLPKTPGGS